MKIKRKHIYLIGIIWALVIGGCANNYIAQEDNPESKAVESPINKIDQSSDELAKIDDKVVLSDSQKKMLASMQASDIQDRVQEHQAIMASSNRAKISEDTHEKSDTKEQEDAIPATQADKSKEVAVVDNPAPPPAPYTPVRVSGLGNSGMEFLTMDEADIWAGDQMLNPDSPWSGQKGWNGWFTTSVAYQIDALGNVNHSYRFTVDFYK